MRTSEQYQNTVHRVGRVSFALALLWFFLIPTIVCARYDIFPAFKTYLNASLSLFLILTPIALSEIISFVPLFGSGASYLAFETGNVSNLKLPCAMNSLKLANVQPGTDESEVLCTISVAISSIVTTVIVLVVHYLIFPISGWEGVSILVMIPVTVLCAKFLHKKGQIKVRGQEEKKEAVEAN